MANNYVEMSESYKLNPKQVEWFKKFFQDCESVGDADEEDPEGAALIQRLTEILQPDMESVEDSAESALSYLELDNEDGETGLWVHGDECIDVDLVIGILRRMLQETDDDRILTGTWAATCSKPRVGEFGGGWFAVSATEERYGNSWDDAQNATKAMQKK